jgi:hypothetical protein
MRIPHAVSRPSHRDDERAGALRPMLNISRHAHGERLGWILAHHTTIIPTAQNLVKHGTA